MPSLPASLAVTGAFFLLSAIVLAITQAPLGSPLFFACASGAGLSYLAMLRRVWHEPRAPQRLLTAAFLLAVAFRAPLRSEERRVGKECRAWRSARHQDLQR